MASTISGNVANHSANEIVYIYENQQQPLKPATTQVDGSGNFSFSGLSAGTYVLYTAVAPQSLIQVIADGVSTFANVNFSA